MEERGGNELAGGARVLEEGEGAGDGVRAHGGVNGEESGVEEFGVGEELRRVAESRLERVWGY